MSEEWRPRIDPKGLLRRDPVRGIDVLVLPERVVRLNRTAAAILGLCDGSSTPAEIAATLSSRFDCGDVGSEVDAFLRRTVAEGWVR